MYETLDQNSTVGGLYTCYICGNNHLHSYWGEDIPESEMEENTPYELVGSSLVQVECPAGRFDIGTEFTFNIPENSDAIFVKCK